MELEAVLKKILDRFDREYQESSRVHALEQKILEGTDQYKYAEQMAVEVGRILNEALREYLPEALIDDILRREAAEVVLKQPMLKAAARVSDTASGVQRNINKKARIGINPIIPEANEDQVNGIITGICNAKSYDEGKEKLFVQTENFLEGHVDDHVQANSSFQYEAGLEATVTRTAASKCCKWCDQLAGTYDYEKVRYKSNDVWKRHKNCHCVIDYEPGLKRNRPPRIRYPSTDRPDAVKIFYEYRKSDLNPNERGYFEALAFRENWGRGSLTEAIERFTNGAVANTEESGRKVFYHGPRYTICYDIAGNYFRITDNEIDSIRRRCVSLDGSPIFNITENGKQRGVTQSEYNMLSHFVNTDGVTGG